MSDELEDLAERYTVMKFQFGSTWQNLRHNPELEIKTAYIDGYRAARAKHTSSRWPGDEDLLPQSQESDE